MSDFYVPRADLAQSILSRTNPDPIFGDQSGLFLAAPRRTGKSTFLRRDLVPLLNENGMTTIYVDLWADRDADPAQLIADAIATELEALAGRLGKAAKLLPKSIAVGGVKVELPSAQGGRTATLTDALIAIGDRTGKHVALIVDEAQHALDSDAGLDAIFALKAARDAMNQRADGVRLILIFTGSHRDKLAGFVAGHKDPFYGAEVSDFPKLGRSYTDAVVAAFNSRLAADNQLDPDDVETAFALVGHQPEILKRLLRDTALGETGSGGLRRTITERAGALRALRWEQLRSDYGALTRTQRAVLAILAADGARFTPFAEATLKRMSEVAGRKLETQDVQKALNALRDKSLVWRPARGSYALEDQDMRDWFLADRGEA